MRVIILIAITFTTLLSFYSCQDTLGLDDYKKDLVTGDTSLFRMIDTLYLDSLVKDTVFVDTSRVDTVFKSDTIWKEVYHAFYSMEIYDGYSKNQKIDNELKINYHLAESSRITFSNDENNKRLFIDIEIYNSLTDFIYQYSNRHEIIKRIKLKLDGLDPSEIINQKVNGSKGSGNYAEIEVIGNDNSNDIYKGSECNFQILTNGFETDTYGNITSIYLFFAAKLETKSVFHDWLILNGAIYIRF